MIRSINWVGLVGLVCLAALISLSKLVCYGVVFCLVCFVKLFVGLDRIVCLHCCRFLGGG